MPTNEFEKQVQQKMDELAFPPSTNVWQKVEKQIERRRGRRQLLLWLPIILCMMGGSVFWIFKSTNPLQPPGSLTKNVTPGVYSDGIRGRNHDLLNPDVKKEADRNKTGGIAKKEAANKENEQGENSKVLSKKRRYESRHVLIENRKRNETSVNNFEGVTTMGIRVTNRTSGKGIQNLSKRKTDSAIAPEERKEIEIIANNETKDLQQDVAIGNELIKNDSNITKSTAVNKDFPLDSTTVSSNKKSDYSKKAAINWEVAAKMGFANISNGLFSGLFKSSNVNGPAAFPNPASNGSVNNGTPSQLKSGPAFAIGLNARKAIGKKWAIIAGINYHYYSYKIGVGQKRDSSTTITQPGNRQFDAMGYYSATNTGNYNYTNHFHFVELPLGVERALGSHSHFYLKAGITLAWFLASNALHYDSQRNIYYKDNSLFNKTQVNIYSDLSYILIDRNLVLKVGPQFQYGLTNLYKNEIFGSGHLFFAGIITRLSLSGK